MTAFGPPTLIDMMDDYTDYMEQYVETLEKFEELESEELSTEEALYYAEVASRIGENLLEIEY